MDAILPVNIRIPEKFISGKEDNHRLKTRGQETELQWKNKVI